MAAAVASGVATGIACVAGGAVASLAAFVPTIGAWELPAARGCAGGCSARQAAICQLTASTHATARPTCRLGRPILIDDPARTRLRCRSLTASGSGGLIFLGWLMPSPAQGRRSSHSSSASGWAGAPSRTASWTSHSASTWVSQTSAASRSAAGSTQSIRAHRMRPSGSAASSAEGCQASRHPRCQRQTMAAGPSRSRATSWPKRRRVRSVCRRSMAASSRVPSLSNRPRHRSPRHERIMARLRFMSSLAVPRPLSQRACRSVVLLVGPTVRAADELPGGFTRASTPRETNRRERWPAAQHLATPEVYETRRR